MCVSLTKKQAIFKTMNVMIRLVMVSRYESDPKTDCSRLLQWNDVCLPISHHRSDLQFPQDADNNLSKRSEEWETGFTKFLFNAVTETKIQTWKNLQLNTLLGFHFPLLRLRCAQYCMPSWAFQVFFSSFICDIYNSCSRVAAMKHSHFRHPQLSRNKYGGNKSRL